MKLRVPLDKTKTKEFLRREKLKRSLKNDAQVSIPLWWDIILTISALLEVSTWIILPHVLKRQYCCYRPPPSLVLPSSRKPLRVLSVSINPSSSTTKRKIPVGAINANRDCFVPACLEYSSLREYNNDFFAEHQQQEELKQKRRRLKHRRGVKNGDLDSSVVRSDVIPVANNETASFAQEEDFVVVHKNDKHLNYDSFRNLMISNSSSSLDLYSNAIHDNSQLVLSNGSCRDVLHQMRQISNFIFMFLCTIEALIRSFLLAKVRIREIRFERKLQRSPYEMKSLPGDGVSTRLKKRIVRFLVTRFTTSNATHRRSSSDVRRRPVRGGKFSLLDMLLMGGGGLIQKNLLKVPALFALLDFIDVMVFSSRVLVVHYLLTPMYVWDVHTVVFSKGSLLLWGRLSSSSLSFDSYYSDMYNSINATIVKWSLLSGHPSSSIYVRSLVASFDKYLQHRQKRTIGIVKRKALQRFVKNPKTFIRQIRDLLNGIRVAKYVAPVLGSLNKLRGVSGDYQKTKKYVMNSHRASIFVQSVLKQKAWKEELVLRATIALQRRFREKRRLARTPLDQRNNATASNSRQRLRNNSSSNMRKSVVEHLETVSNYLEQSCSSLASNEVLSKSRDDDDNEKQERIGQEMSKGDRSVMSDEFIILMDKCKKHQEAEEAMMFVQTALPNMMKLEKDENDGSNSSFEENSEIDEAIVERTMQQLELRATRELDQSENERKEAAAVRIQTMVRMKQAKHKLRILKTVEHYNELKAEAETMISRIERQSKKKRPSSLDPGEEGDDAFGLEDADFVEAAASAFAQMKVLRGQLKEMTQKPLLLKPESSHFVWWKRLVMLCVVFELFRKAIIPLLLQSTNSSTLEQCFETMLMPDFCKVTQQKKSSSLDIVWKNVRQFFPSSWSTSTNNPALDECYHMRLARRAIAVQITRFINSYIWFVGIISFLHCFAMFFEGRRDANGVLVPKPFVQRWIFPGIAFQLLVNPAMAQLSAVIKHVVFYIYVAGPTRVLRWMIVFYPWFGYSRLSFFYTLDKLFPFSRKGPKSKRGKKQQRKPNAEMP